MTISEAQSVLHCPDAYGGIYGEKYGQALEVAFKSLEAWEKVRVEIGKLSTVWEYGQGVEDCFDIIDKHLQEVEE